jgi:hypothetical protein
MSRVSWPAVPGPERPALLAAPGRDAAVAMVAALLTAGHAVAASVTVVAAVTALMVGQIQRHAERRQRPA